MSWDLVHAFLVVTEAGSISRAAAQLGQSQPTLSRQIAAFEKQLGTRLFERNTRGLHLTAAGERMVEPARRMRAAALQVGLAAEQARTDLAGTVRLSASEMTATWLLPAALAALRTIHPEIQIELVVSNEIDNLLAREADIAIRHAKPLEAGVIARHIGDMEVCAWAHRDYLARLAPGIADDPSALDWIGMDQSDFMIRKFNAAGLRVDRNFFCVRCDDQAVNWQMAVAGLGVGFAPKITAAHWPDMQPVLTNLTTQSLPVWLASHRELRQSALIRAVYEALANAASNWFAVIASSPNS